MHAQPYLVLRVATTPMRAGVCVRVCVYLCVRDCHRCFKIRVKSRLVGAVWSTVTSHR